MNTYDWSILRMICNSQQNGESNVVVRVRWKCTATDGTNTTQKDGFCNIPYDPNGSFVEYSNLTESEVLTWAWTVVDRAATEAALDQTLTNMNNLPQVVLDLPWAATQV